MPGLYFEEFTVGQLFDHPIRRTITETDNVLMTTMTHNPAMAGTPGSADPLAVPISKFAGKDMGDIHPAEVKRKLSGNTRKGGNALPSQTMTRSPYDLQVMAHEWGHALMEKFEFLADYQIGKAKWAEAVWLAPFIRLVPLSTHRKNLNISKIQKA